MRKLQPIHEFPFAFTISDATDEVTMVNRLVIGVILIVSRDFLALIVGVYTLHIVLMSADSLLCR